MCTGISLKTVEQTVFWGRTQEFDLDLPYQGVIIPKDYLIEDTLTAFETKYAVMGIGVKGMSTMIDGVNQAGIAGGSFYFAHYNNYSSEKSIKDQGKKALRGQEVVLWALSNCATLEEIKTRINSEIGVAEGELSLPQHYVFQDTKGNSIVVEPSIENGFKIFDNPIGIFTNNPPFDWHLINLKNYVQLSSQTVEGIRLGNESVFSPGKGSGLLGIPGDYTPQSRFVRATALKFLSARVTKEEAVGHLFHLFNSFDIPKGVVQSKGNANPQTTHYTVVYDLAEKIIYIHNYENRQIQTLKFKEEAQQSKSITRFELEKIPQILEMKEIKN